MYLVPLPSGPPALLFEADPDTSPQVLFSPDARALAIVAAHEVYLVPLPSGPPALLFEADFDVYGRGTPRIRIWNSRIGIAVESARYSHGERVSEVEELHFGWDGAALPAPAPTCPGTLSPDGRYAAIQEGGPYFAGKASIPPLENPWPSVVALDADTCAPIFRVRSAHTGNWNSWERDRTTGWLSTSEGVVVGVRGGYEIARVRPAPEIRGASWGVVTPAPAPTGGGRYFGYGARVYDAAEDRWYGTIDAFLLRLFAIDSKDEVADADVGAHVDARASLPRAGVASWRGFGWWGDSHRERWFTISRDALQNTSPSYLLLPPQIEYPPFSEEIAFRVARTSSCLRLREEPGEGSRVLSCLPDGARLLFAERDAEAKLASEEERHPESVRPPHPSIENDGYYWWVYVRTEDGVAGWVSHDYLDHTDAAAMRRGAR